MKTLILAVALLISTAGFADGYSPFGNFHWKSPVTSVGALPTSGNLPGDARFETTSFGLYVWNGSSWAAISGGGGGGFTALTGDVTASGSGSVAATVAFVATSSAANVHAAELLANAATAANTVSTILKRDGSGQVAATTFTGALAGNATTATSATSATSATTATTATNATNGATVAIATNASFFPLFAASTSNSNQPFNLDSSGITYNPSTNILTTTGGVSTAALTATGTTTLATSLSGVLTAASGVVSSLTNTALTALLNAFVGDSGSGGTKGAVPAPASGDAAAGKFLKADGNWSVPSGGLSRAWWSGYHDATCSWTVTSATIASFSSDASCALTQEKNSGMGTVSGSNTKPQITFTPPRSGTMEICAYSAPGTNTDAVARTYQLTDGTTTFASNGAVIRTDGGTVIGAPLPLCGFLDVTAVSTTIEMKGASASGTITMTALGVSRSAIEWRMKYID